MPQTTPAKVTAPIKAFCHELAPGSSPVFVSAESVAGTCVNECFDNVELSISRNGGEAVIGWTIWDTDGVLLEAERHAVRKQPDGELIDPSPRVDGEEHLLFLPDPSAIDDGGVTPSRHYPLVDWPEVEGYVQSCERYFQLKMDYHPQSPPEAALAPVAVEMERRQKELQQRIVQEQGLRSLLSETTLSLEEAVSRFNEDPSDVQASSAAARHAAAQGDFSEAFDFLLRSSETGPQAAKDVGETFRLLLTLCQDKGLVTESRNQWSMFLN
ncbi:hypothetical protein [Alienimonas sp. DA493]|uniref:hypothetical protein n=1 Tax=Alienimonas sp. DA493 TaxID=3373605 RepID=UPI003753F9D9